MGRDQNKTKEQLITELDEMRQRITELETSESKRNQIKTTISFTEKDLHNLLDLMPVGVSMLDMKGVILYCNPALCRMTGYTIGEFTGKHFSEVPSIRAENISIAHRLFNSLKGEETRKPFEDIYQCADGTISWSDVHPCLIKIGSKRRILMTHHDITERKQIEQALQDTSNLQRSLFAQAAESLVLVDVDTGALMDFNEAAYTRLGYTREEFARLKLADVEAKESPEEVAKHIERLVKQGSDIFETQHRTKNGDIYDIEMSSKIIQLSGKKYAQSIWRNITELKRAKEALKQSEERA